MDRPKWDAILHQLMPERTVWGFANDDTHGSNHFGRNRNVFLISDLTIENVRSAMEHGHLYLYIPVEIGDRPDITIVADRLPFVLSVLSFELFGLSFTFCLFTKAGNAMH